MKTMFKALITATMVFSVGVGFVAAPAFAGSQTQAARPANSDLWIRMNPTPQNSDPKAVAIVKSLRPDLEEYYRKVGNPLVLYAYFFKHGTDKTTYIIGRLESINACGTIGCDTYIFANTGGNKWRQLMDNTFNYIAMPPDYATSEKFILRTLDEPRGPEYIWTLGPQGFTEQQANPALPGLAP